MNSRIFGVIIIIISLSSFWGKQLLSTNDSSQEPPFMKIKSPWADSLMLTMNLDEKIGQLFMVAANGKGTDEAYYLIIDSLIENYGLGGLIYFQSEPHAHI